MHILDNKSLARGGAVRSATALTTNIVQNLDDFISFASQPGFNTVGRIDQVRNSLQATRAAVLAGQALPGNVQLVVTNFGGQSTGASARLAARGITFRDLTAPEILGPTGRPARGFPEEKPPTILGPSGKLATEGPSAESPTILGPTGRPTREIPSPEPPTILGPTGQPARGTPQQKVPVILGPTGRPAREGPSTETPTILGPNGKPAREGPETETLSPAAMEEVVDAIVNLILSTHPDLFLPKDWNEQMQKAYLEKLKALEPEIQAGIKANWVLLV